MDGWIPWTGREGSSSRPEEEEEEENEYKSIAVELVLIYLN
jgi:hypothetical protein